MNVAMENSIAAIDANNLVTPNVPPNKRRTKKSMVWNYFTIEPVSAGCSRACCNQCKKTFAYISGSKQAGTSHLKRHIVLGICPVSRLNQEKDQLIPSQNNSVRAPPRKRCRASPGSVTLALDRENCIHEIAKMVTLHDYPINMVEQPGFIEFAQTLQPNFSAVSSDTVHSEIMCIYRREKQLVANLLDGLPGRVSLSIDLWTSDQTVGYAILIGHFIDSEWRLQSRVLKFVAVPCPDSEVAFNHAVVSCLSEWNLDNKLFALTLDPSFSSESVVGNLRELLSPKNPHMLNGKFLVVDDCYARVLSRLAQEGLSAMREIVVKVRNSVKYVKSSESRERTFDQLRERLQVPSTKSLVIDNQKRWDSSYLMLSAGCELKEVFSCLDASDSDYKETPSMEEWKYIEILCHYLNIFYEAADILTSETYPSCDVFFHPVHKVQYQLKHGSLSGDPFISNFVRPLHKIFDKYWKNSCVVLGMAAAMDPRYKLQVTKYIFSNIFQPEDAMKYVRFVEEGINDLYFEYIAQTLPLPSIQEYVKDDELHEDGVCIPPSDALLDFDVYVSEISGTHETKSELEQYLDEALLPRGVEGFNVVEWWKLNRMKYPILSKMAADILSIPMATISGESVFDIGIKKLDEYHCSLKPRTLEALLCAKNWLKYGMQERDMSGFDFSTAIMKMEM